MDRKAILAIGIVMILLVSTIAIYGITNPSGDSSGVEHSGRLLVYGNSNNDDYLDEEDLVMMQAVVAGEADWNREENPLMDTNADGVVDESDVELLQKILNKEDCLMYYVDYSNGVSSVHYPVTGNIGVVENYGMMVCQTLGIYDRITAGTTWCTTESEDRYPGCSDFFVIGTGRVPEIEKVLAADISIILGSVNKSVVAIQDELEDAGVRCDYIYLSFTNVAAGQSWASSVLTLGTLLSCEEAAQKYVKYYDSITDYIHEATKGLDGGTYILAYDTDNSQSTFVDTKGADGTMYGDVFCISHLPLTDLCDPRGDGFYEISIESVIKMDPDRIFITMWSVLDDSTTPDEGQEFFEQKCEYFKGTRAYETGQIYGLCYETFGTYLGIGGLPLLAAYIWPDIFDEDKGWDLLQECYDEFTLMDKDVRECGGIQCYRMHSDVSTPDIILDSDGSIDSDDPGYRICDVSRETRPLIGGTD